MIIGIHHAGLAVRDLDRAVAFYRRAAGLTEAHRLHLTDDPDFAALTGLHEHSADVVLLKGENAFLAIACFDSPSSERAEAAERPVSEAGITHICSQEQQIDSLAARYRQAGARFREEPVALGTGTVYAYVRDPESNVIELEGTHYAPPGERPWLAHVALATHDIGRLCRFYTALIGREVTREGEYGDNPLIDKVTGLENTHVKAAWIDGENQVVEIWQYLNPATLERKTERAIYKPGWAYWCFEVADIGLEYERIRRLGAHFVTPPRNFRGASFCFARDPDGNLFALLELPPDKRELSLHSVADLDVVSRTHENRPRQQGANT